MKAIFKMSIAFVAVFAFGLNANAQSENSGMTEEEMAKAILSDTTKVYLRTLDKAEITISTGDVVVGKNADGEDVVAHEGDTIYTYGYRYFWKNGLRKAPKVDVGHLQKTETVRDEVLWSKLKKAAVETQFAEAMASSSGRERDTKWDEVTDGKDTLKIVRHGVDKNHWYVAAQGDYQISDGCNGFGGTAELQYFSDSFWWSAVGAGLTRNEMYEKAENPRESYTSYFGQALGGLKADLGRRKNIMLTLYAGIRGTWNQTNTRMSVDEFGNAYEMKSTHTNYTPVVGAMARYRLPDTRIAFFVRADWSQKAYTFQNGDNERHSALKFSVGASVGLHGNVVKTK